MPWVYHLWQPLHIKENHSISPIPVLADLSCLPYFSIINSASLVLSQLRYPSLYFSLVFSLSPNFSLFTPFLSLDHNLSFLLSLCLSYDPLIFFSLWLFHSISFDLSVSFSHSLSKVLCHLHLALFPSLSLYLISLLHSLPLFFCLSLSLNLYLTITISLHSSSSL